ncbi:hypothetical protein BPORC_1901 [Bifidobacterium porcinum]|nr:hypothetical protein BPORC_1901 [Bifidobacterium porcinum]
MIILVHWIVGIPRFCGGVVVGGPVSVRTGSVFGSQFRFWSAGSGRCEAGVPVAGFEVLVGSLVFCGFVAVPWSVGTLLAGLLWTESLFRPSLSDLVRGSGWSEWLV